MFTEVALGTSDPLSLPIDVKLSHVKGFRITGLPTDIGTYRADQVHTKLRLTLSQHFRRSIGRINKVLTGKAIMGFKVLVDAGQCLAIIFGRWCSLDMGN